MESVVTSIVAENGDVKLEWLAPHDGHEEITSYLIEIFDGVSDWN